MKIINVTIWFYSLSGDLLQFLNAWLINLNLFSFPISLKKRMQLWWKRCRHEMREKSEQIYQQKKRNYNKKKFSLSSNYTLPENHSTFDKLRRQSQFNAICVINYSSHEHRKLHSPIKPESEKGTYTCSFSEKMAHWNPGNLTEHQSSTRFGWST